MSEATLFEQAIAISSSTERSRFVERAFAGRIEEKERFLKLLAAHDEQDELLDRPNTLAETELKADNPEEIGATIGKYKLLQRIGQGGFGVVYLAEETETINRRVALKVIKPGMGSKEVIARFEAERQALAMMEHDNIARVYGGGTTDAGLPYFVMELVKGIPITEYCVQKKLAPEDRLRLFISVCRGVQHAHQKGVIHRDLKPSNILVAEFDHHPVVKIIDFGVAKALNQRLTEQTLFTHYGSVIGTVQYMSPEQAKFNQLDVDTRSDVYSLGAVLYELLTGDTPISGDRVRSASFEDVIRWICEEEPSKPSTKVVATVSALDSSKDAQHKRLRLSRLIRGDLDWIAMKALEKDRDRRYEAASEFADDLQRYLDQEPVLASPPSFTYRASKFVRRHRTAVASVATMTAFLLLGTAFFIRWKLEEIDNGRIRADNRAAQLELELAHQQESQRLRREQIDNQTIPRIEALIQSSDYRAAFDLLQQVGRELPEHERLQELLGKASSRWSIRTEPRGAHVTLREYAHPQGEPQATIVTPAKIDLSKAAYRFRIELDGFETVDGFAGPESVSLYRKLDVKGSIPPGMVRVPASLSSGISDDYLIDRFEVTNRQFQEFVDGGGYGDQSLWSELDQGKDWKQSIAAFVDQTGHPGPRYWMDGNYLPGTADLPVVGICWAEAAAFAKANRKQLPTVQHWNHACGEEAVSTIVPESNLRSGSLMPVGQSAAIGPYGTVDMFGNAAEWCFNAYGEASRMIAGNSFNGPEYGVGASTPMSAVERVDFVGFRCMLPLGPRQEQLYAGRPDDRNVPFDGRQPVDDLRYEVLRATYNYDTSLPLKEQQEATQDNAMPGIRHELFSLDAAYGERMFMHIFRTTGPIPDDAQILVFMPGSGGFTHGEFAGSASPFIATLVGTGRIFAVPIIDGMYERKKVQNGVSSPAYDIAKQIKDIRRGVDFLKKSPQYGHAKFGFVGLSYGARLGPIVCALEPRFECAIYLAGGIPLNATTPQFDTVNFAPRATQPAIMINGTEDHIFPLESSQKPMFTLLGADEGKKDHLLIEGGGHNVQFKGLSVHLSRFLDEHLGRINSTRWDWRQQFAGYDSQAATAWSNRDPTSTKELIQKQIALIQEQDSSDDAELLAETRFRLGIATNDPQLETELYRVAVAEAQSALGQEHAATRRMRTALAYALTLSSISKVLTADDVSEPSYAVGKRELAEVELLIPTFAWPHLGLAAVAVREGKNNQAYRYLKACEHLPFTWNLEFSMRALLAARAGNQQEARDWIIVSAIEMTNHYQEGLLPRSERFIAEYQELKNSRGGVSPVSTNPEEAVQRLLTVYPEHYYLHWLKGYLAVRNSAMDAAHEAFQVAFDICPGFRSTDWLAITSQWHNDQERLRQCRQRLIELANLKDGCFMWDGVHMARVYCLTKPDNDYTQDEVAVFKRHAERARWFYRGKTADSLLGWLRYRQGETLRIASFIHKGSPEEQVESMILDAITEHRFGSQSVAYDKLAAAREFIAKVIPVPNGPAFKYIDSAHAWCVAQLLLREATELTELKSEDFAPQAADIVAKLRADLRAKFGEENTEKLLLKVGNALVVQNRESEPSGEAKHE